MSFWWKSSLNSRILCGDEMLQEFSNFHLLEFVAGIGHYWMVVLQV